MVVLQKRIKVDLSHLRIYKKNEAQGSRSIFVIFAPRANKSLTYRHEIEFESTHSLVIRIIKSIRKWHGSLHSTSDVSKTY